jgi:hypothetical protein
MTVRDTAKLFYIESMKKETTTTGNLVPVAMPWVPKSKLKKKKKKKVKDVKNGAGSLGSTESL